MFEMFLSPNHALQRTRPSRRGCNPTPSRAGPLSLGRYAALRIHMKSTLSVLLFVGYLLCSETVRAQANFSAIHDTSRLMWFANTNDIARHFETNKISVVTYPLKRYADDYYWVAAYPYSGADTIDLYCFRHHGPQQWRIQMVYFALSPETRKLTLIEQETEFVIRDGDRQLISYAVKKRTK